MLKKISLLSLILVFSVSSMYSAQYTVQEYKEYLKRMLPIEVRINTQERFDEFCSSAGIERFFLCDFARSYDQRPVELKSDFVVFSNLQECDIRISKGHKVIPIFPPRYSKKVIIGCAALTLAGFYTACLYKGYTKVPGVISLQNFGAAFAKKYPSFANLFVKKSAVIAVDVLGNVALKTTEIIAKV